MDEDVRRELDGLRATLDGARAMPMSASVVVNRPDVLAAVARLEQALETAGAAAGDVLARRDAVVAEGEATAGEIVRQAELQRDQLVSDSEVFRVANRRAEQRGEEVRAECTSLRRDVDDYVEQRLAALEHSLERTLGEVRRGIVNLSGRTDLSEDGPVAEPGVLLPERDAG